MNHLVENDTRVYLWNTLHHCHEYKMNHFSLALNISIFILFSVATFVFLYNRYKGSPTIHEKHQREMEIHHDVMIKLDKLQKKSRRGFQQYS